MRRPTPAGATIVCPPGVKPPSKYCTNVKPTAIWLCRVGGTGGLGLGLNRGQADFVLVYDEHVWRFYGFLAYRLHDPDVAKDLTQTKFERALRAWSRFNPRRASELTWLLAIARNLFIDRHRTDKSDRNEPIDERLLPRVPGPEQRLSADPDLTEALAQLSDREVVALRFGGDLSRPEIAVLMDLSLANVQQILSRSLRKLRALLEGSGPSGQRAQGSSAIGQPERTSKQWNQ